MVFANIYNRIGALEERLNALSQSSSTPVDAVNPLNLEAYDNKISQLEARVVAVEGTLASPETADKLAAFETRMNEMVGLLATLTESVNDVNRRMNEMVEQIQNA